MLLEYIRDLGNRPEYDYLIENMNDEHIEDSNVMIDEVEAFIMNLGA